MNIDDGGDPKVRRKSLKMEMWARIILELKIFSLSCYAYDRSALEKADEA